MIRFSSLVIGMAGLVWGCASSPSGQQSSAGAGDAQTAAIISRDELGTAAQSPLQGFTLSQDQDTGSMYSIYIPNTMG